MIKTRPLRGVVPVAATPFIATGGFDDPAPYRVIDFSCSQSIGELWGLGTGREDMNLGYDKYADANEQERALFMKYDGGFRSV